MEVRGSAFAGAREGVLRWLGRGWVGVLVLAMVLGGCGGAIVETMVPPTVTQAAVTPRPTQTQDDTPEATPAAMPAITSTVGPVDPEVVGDKLGVDLGGVGDRGLEFVDVALTLRQWESLNASACPESDDACRYAPLDAAGWPTTDARTVFFDKRPFGAWWSQDQADCPECQDGDFQIAVSGAYRLAFTGQATLQAAEGAVEVQNQTYDAASNTTTADVVVKPGQGLLFVAFADTRRTPESEANTGIADVRLLRPGYDLDTETTFTPHILKAVEPFSTLRFMNWVGGNNINPPFDPETDHTLDWDERTLPTDRQNQGEGVAWEYVIELANLTGKNVWLNVPVHASDDYVRGLAQLLKDELHPDAVIYLEHSNEVWNPIFTQYDYNRSAAAFEVKEGDSNLDTGGVSLEGLWAQRRHVRRLVEISEIFREVFGDSAINSRVRVIHAWWAIEPASYDAQLAWVAETYGPPDHYLYAVAAAGYIGIEGLPESASVAEVLDRLQRSSDSQARGPRLALRQVADRYDLKLTMYEGGPDTSKPLQWDRDTRFLLTLIDAHRDPGMKDVIVHDLWQNWFGHPEIQGDIFIYFTLQSQYNRWGMWGLTEDITDLNTPKFQAVYELTGYQP